MSQTTIPQLTGLPDGVLQRLVDVAQPLRIILFGSAARGETSAASDFDLMVVMPPDTDCRAMTMRLYRSLRGLRAPVDLVVVTSDELARHGDKPGLVYRAALREGRELYAA
jgi:predicted nucleotidyltransferase